MKLQFSIKQDDFTSREIGLRDLWRLLGAYLRQGRKLTVYVEDPSPDGIQTKITASKL